MGVLGFWILTLPLGRGLDGLYKSHAEIKLPLHDEAAGPWRGDGLIVLLWEWGPPCFHTGTFSSLGTIC